ncbi:hypothetical protein HN011_000464 [Eciton burchellii]|nr:hypothetical protein HN011_000464 [Eciton burchellii]
MTNSNDQIDPEKAMNFVPNSLSKTPRRIVLDEVKENIRLCSSKPEESAIMIDYNLNSTYGEKKSLFRDKWHSRTNSLDENSIFQNLELIDKQENGKSSLQNIFLESTRNHHRLMADVKARSEGALQTDTKKRYDRRGSHEERLLQAVEATTEDFRKKLESFASQRRSILDDKQRKMMPRSTDASVSRSREKSPMKSKYAITTAAKNQDKENGVGKNIACDKRKRKKTSEKNQNTSENALEPSKLISLSLSLLLAALLQAVRCLTDLVEDAFRSISYDRNGLLQLCLRFLTKLLLFTASKVLNLANQPVNENQNEKIWKNISVFEHGFLDERVNLDHLPEQSVQSHTSVRSAKERHDEKRNAK